MAFGQNVESFEILLLSKNMDTKIIEIHPEGKYQNMYQLHINILGTLLIIIQIKIENELTH